MYVPAGRQIRLDPGEPGRHPRVLRPAVPVQARRGAGSGQQFRLQRGREHGRRRADVQRPVRGALRLGPQRDAVPGEGPERRPTSTPGSPTRSPRRTRPRRPRRAPSPGRPAPRRRPARPARARPSRSVPSTSRTSRPTCRPRRTRPSRSSSTTRTTACRTTSPSTRARRAGRPSSRARSSRGSAVKTYDVGALPAGAYSFVCTVHPNMTGTLTAN